MTYEEIRVEAQRVAHQFSPACRNRPAIYADQGHGVACQKLAAAIDAAMREAAGK